MIPRILAKEVLKAAKQFPVIAITGPRQAGKSTLVKSLFPNKPYVSLEDLDTRAFASNDPRGFLSKYANGAILDEVQRTPDLFSYLQTFVDQEKKNGQFVLTGSQHFLLMESISQTLAGRIRIFNLLPFSLAELRGTRFEPKSPESFIYKGMYPRIYDQKIDPKGWYPSYIQTYLERDVRLIKNVNDLNVFQKFLKMCAARTAQLVNLSSLANDCGITHNTAKAWLNILEASFLIYFLHPYHKNFNKRLIKMPKLYFDDTGLACSLLGIENEHQLTTHSLRGNLFETAIVSEFLKGRFNVGLPSNLYFWRDKTGNEIDCLIEQAENLIPIEIKSGKTVSEDFFKSLHYWNKLPSQKQTHSYLIYAGEHNQKRALTTVLSWNDLPSFQ